MELGSWTQLGNDIDGEAADDRSGGSVALSSDGHTLAVGAFWNDEAYHEAGHVRVYAWDSSSWTQLGDDIDGKGARVYRIFGCTQCRCTCCGNRCHEIPGVHWPHARLRGNAALVTRASRRVVFFLANFCTVTVLLY